MFLIKQGDVGPRVIMIQGILRRVGINIGVDGQFGPGTVAAVQTFQRRPDVHLNPDGQIGIETWAAIERISHFRVINVVDAEDEAQRQRVMGGLDRAHARDVIVMHGQSNALASAVAQILNLVNSSGSCAMVRFYAHGREGTQGVATGHDGSTLAHLSGMTVASLPQITPSFARLNGILAPFGCIDLMGCSVGGGTAGVQLLSGLANAAAHPVEGGINTQYSQNEGYVPFNFEGPVRQTYPNGTSMQAWGRHVQTLVSVTASTAR